MTVTDMRPVTEYFLCVIATPILSEFPLTILELVDEKDGTAPTNERILDQKFPQHGKSTSNPFDLGSPQNGHNELSGVDARRQRNKIYGVMLATVTIPLLYMLWQVISFTSRMQISKQETLLFQCFYWTLTLATASRLTYALSACARFYVYVFRPFWLPKGTPLRVQAFRTCGAALSLMISLMGIVVVGFLVKVLVYDNLVKLAGDLFGKIV
ncbi:uncharacterized protein Z520_04566 [Fonsecaea multimorphosa CBS 102226]|uniref:Uncharacterized protein n=1 Tax=Fonsecaea multimorphosa CBS 102226 TaxID=1442371 RepID=A0A0D2K9X4_9EURO|nr:uncharacterized protein Z520_04566 [Fonsecaea multimorphosa CBS 102226]KIX99929.1 hypothetical protein Z520_04566 [Fonsecaea multimorphosa CBS 102226]OAL26404.1 hypothetical protein AYO22_04322 [Fonsecaea multimorphosa]